MNSNQFLSDESVLKLIGKRLAQRRLTMHLTQAVLAEQAGVGKRTVERLEAGGSVQLTSLVRILRSLDLLDGLDQLVPEIGPSPLDMLKLKGKQRQRASKRAAKKPPTQQWDWGDDS